MPVSSVFVVVKSMQKINVLLGVFCVAIAANSAHADVKYTLDDPSLAAVVEQSPITVRSLDILLERVRRQDVRQTRSHVLSELVNNRLLALSAAESQVSNDEGVGFRDEETIRNRLSVLARQLYGKEMEEWLKTKPEGFASLVTFRNPELYLQLKDIFSVGSLLGYQASDDQKQRMKSVQVLAYQLSAGSSDSITLYDLYQSQNIQGKIALNRGDLEFVDKQARLELAERFSLWWLEENSDLSTADIISLKTAVSDRVARVYVEKKLGLYNVMHSDNKGLKQWREKVTQEEVVAYFNSHRDEFVRLTAVKVRHLRVDSQEKADAVYEKLEKGLSFPEAVKTYSTSDDKMLAEPGSLGWFERSAQAPSWFESMAYMQEPGVVSRPVRSPGDKPYWEIVLIDEQKTGFHAPDSETVRYIAGNAVALEKAKQGYRDLLASLRAQHDVRVNPNISQSL